MMRVPRISVAGKILKHFGKKIVFQSEYNELISNRVLVSKLRKIREIAQESANSDLTHFLISNITETHAQQVQDLMAIYFADSKPGFFVEFGATDGVDFSNTFLLEERYGWQGIVAEPAKMWHRDLYKNRKCQISEKCVYSVTGKELNFSEAASGKLSTLIEYKDSDGHSRQVSSEYTVITVSLEDLLLEFSAPNYIDFLSIDTEGSEFEIIQNFNFSKFKFGFICIEHNHTENNEKIEDILTTNGYIRILIESSDFDGWFLNSKLFEEFFSNR